MVCFGCGVAPMWPESMSECCTRRVPITTTQAAVTVARTRHTSRVLERFVVGHSDRRTWSPSSSVAGVRPAKSVRSRRYATRRVRDRQEPQWTAARFDVFRTLGLAQMQPRFAATATSDPTPVGAAKDPSIGATVSPSGLAHIDRYRVAVGSMTDRVLNGTQAALPSHISSCHD